MRSARSRRYAYAAFWSLRAVAMEVEGPNHTDKQHGATKLLSHGCRHGNGFLGSGASVERHHHASDGRRSHFADEQDRDGRMPGHVLRLVLTEPMTRQDQRGIPLTAVA